MTSSDSVITGDAEGAVMLYLDRMRLRGKRPNSVRTARRVLARLSRWADGPILYLDRNDLLRWQGELAGRITPAGVRSEISYVRGFYRWAHHEQLLTDDPAIALDPPMVPRYLPRPISEANLHKALQLTTDRHVRAMLGLAAFAGLRSCEISRLEWSHLHLDDPEPHLWVVEGKGAKPRVVDVSGDLAALLTALPHRAGPVIPRLDGRPGQCGPERISQRANAYLSSIGLGAVETPGRSRKSGGWTLHTLRHRFGTVAYNESGDLHGVQEAMGHASPVTTSGYAQVSRRNSRRITLAAGSVKLTGETL